MLRPVEAADAPAIAAIYAHYVGQSVATFEEVAPDAAEMGRRIAATATTYPWLVAEADGMILGYAYGRSYHVRAAYRWTCETSIYLAHDRRGRGLGRQLYGALLERLSARGFVSAIACITMPNPESTVFHEQLGFKAVGMMPGIGFKFGAWRDVGYWQLALGPHPVPPVETI